MGLTELSNFIGAILIVIKFSISKKHYDLLHVFVHFVYSGALTHSVKALDISLKIDTELALKVGRRTKRA